LCLMHNARAGRGSRPNLPPGRQPHVSSRRFHHGPTGSCPAAQRVTRFLVGANSDQKLCRDSRSAEGGVSIKLRTIWAVSPDAVHRRGAWAWGSSLRAGPVHEYISAAILRLNESIALRRDEPLRWHEPDRGARPLRDRSSEITVGKGKQGQTRISGLYAVPARGSTARCDDNKGQTPLDHRADKAHCHTIIGHNTRTIQASVPERPVALPPAIMRSVTCGSPYSA
jgi:hypothetical protein